MGRSSGGGGRSSGGFGGGRSSGGFSGGGRSSRGGFSGGGFGHRNSGSSFGFYHRPMYGGWGPRYYGNGCGCGGGITTILILFILLLFLDFPSGCVILGCAPGCTPGQSSEIYTQTEYTTSTKREPLEGIVSKTDWYEDQLGWISSENVLIEGLEDFYKQTGIQPYVLFVKYSEDLWNDGNLDPTLADEYLEQVYEEKFSDEGHFIFAYFQCANDSKQEMEGEFRYLGGYSTDTIMDNEAIRILWGYFENNYYNTSLTIEEMISNTFSQYLFNPSAPIAYTNPKLIALAACLSFLSISDISFSSNNDAVIECKSICLLYASIIFLSFDISATTLNSI